MDIKKSRYVITGFFVRMNGDLYYFAFLASAISFSAIVT